MDMELRQLYGDYTCYEILANVVVVADKWKGKYTNDPSIDTDVQD